MRYLSTPLQVYLFVIEVICLTAALVFLVLMWMQPSPQFYASGFEGICAAVVARCVAWLRMRAVPYLDKQLSCSDEPEKSPEVGRPEVFGPAPGSPQLPKRGLDRTSQLRALPIRAGRAEASEASVGESGGDMARLPAQPK